MKIPNLSGSMRWGERVRDKDSANGQSRQQGGSGQQKNPSQEGGSDDSPENFKATSEKVSAAIDSFSQEAQAQSNGLRVEQEGQGPGLRVVLRDGMGAVVRQFTGEEFVQLREAAMQEAKPRGRLLDRKL